MPGLLWSRCFAVRKSRPSLERESSSQRQCRLNGPMFFNFLMAAWTNSFTSRDLLLPRTASLVIRRSRSSANGRIVTRFRDLDDLVVMDE